MTSSEEDRLQEYLKQAGLPVGADREAPPRTEPAPTGDMSWCLIGHVVGLVAMFYLTWRVLARGLTYEPWGPHSILGVIDGANFLFHEAGHFIFIILGPFMTILGGSLNQVLIPVICAVAFWRQGQRGASAAAVFWAGESLTGVAMYAYDGRARLMPLHGGLDPSAHDWFQLLTRLGLLDRAELVGGLFFAVAIVMLVVALGVLAIETLRMWQARYP